MCSVRRVQFEEECLDHAHFRRLTNQKAEPFQGTLGVLTVEKQTPR